MGQYVESQIGPGEHVVYQAKLHWIVYAEALEAAAGALIFLLIGAGSQPLLAVFCHLAVLACTAAAAYFGVRAYLATLFTELAVTNKRVIAKSGVLGRSTDEQPLSKIERCILDQSVLGRAFGFGDVAVQGVGGHSIPIRRIVQPVRFKEQVMAAIPHPERAEIATP